MRHKETYGFKKKFGFEKNFRSKIMLGPQKFGLKTFWAQKKIGSEKHVGSKIYLCQKKMCVQIKSQKEMYPKPCGKVYLPI